ncbi:tRNA-splicing endonuclease subunit Sen2-1-like [Mercurialis annua]|uniref:tRNA-splicing endonuclease subunit Sen2-1-like n=1 Tax=Mercurialis annua TaxID=3986 RepID=UPI00215EF8B5|nr:tRNA-splicing endonuclease subunit Sen2-1-like [Mercurialis annua]XP_050215468.1 tRNA-splicing endonuclease subunit Sen2-1-like [Mercurialis annua]XP_050215470.1 tRNA-splicing endonuclease subunit Sen2-1-like [Mercurialis annua]
MGGPRWKGKGSKAKAVAEPMSNIVSEFCSSLTQSNAHGLLSGSSVLLAVESQQTKLITRACFGQPVITADTDKQWIQLGLEEAFYLCFNLKCINIVGANNCHRTDIELWQYMVSRKDNFPAFYKAYLHLRIKNWVVRPGSQYGVDFVAYRHHPSLVHSEYAVLVLSEDDANANGRLQVWSDLYCAVRLCGSVAKTLLVLSVNGNCHGATSPSCLDSYSVEERTVTRWILEQNREDQPMMEKGDR